MVEEQSRVQVSVEIDLEREPVLLHLDDERLPVLGAILSSTLFALTHLGEGVRGFDAAHQGGNG